MNNFGKGFEDVNLNRLIIGAAAGLLALIAWGVYLSVLFVRWAF